MKQNYWLRKFLKFLSIKIVLIYLSFLAVSFFCLSNISDSNNFFLKKKINLGLDLQGGSYLLLEVDSTPLQKRQIQSKVIPLKKKLIKNKLFANNTSSLIISIVNLIIIFIGAENPYSSIYQIKLIISSTFIYLFLFRILKIN